MFTPMFRNTFTDIQPHTRKHFYTSLAGPEMFTDTFQCLPKDMKCLKTFECLPDIEKTYF